MAWWYGTFTAFSPKSNGRGTNEHTTKPAPSNVWCTGGGWWRAPTIGSKSWIEKANGHTQPSQPTTSNGWVECTSRVSPARCAHEHRHVGAVAHQRRVGPAQIAFGERRAFAELSPVGQVLARHAHVAARFEHERGERVVGC